MANADLHIHTVLSPCSCLDMSPQRIVQEAIGKKLDIIGITDHNCTLHCAVTDHLARKAGLFVMKGAEVTTREEIHCLAFFPDFDRLDAFQEYIDLHLPKIPDKKGKFGFQVLVDEDDRILKFIDYLLVTALDAGISDVSEKVAELGGIFIPAHIDRPANGLFSQLGFLPAGLTFDALEITSRSLPGSIREKYGIGESVALIKSSDAHFPGQIGSGITRFVLNDLSFGEISLALKGMEDRYLITA